MSIECLDRTTLRTCLALLFFQMLLFAITASAEPHIQAPHPLAVETGTHIYEQGGNAVDAAVAAAFVLTTVEPDRAGLGGGMLALFWPSGGDQPVVFDALEVAPGSAESRATEGWLSVGVPGACAGLAELLGQYGSLPLKEVLAPAIRIAQRGFPVDQRLHAALLEQQSRLSPEAARVLLRRGEPPKIGQKLVQHDLAWSYRQIARLGPGAFYQGEIASRIDHANEGTSLSLADLVAYRVRLSRPLYADYGGFEILTTPPPSAGGVQLLQSLNMLNTFDLQTLGRYSPEFVHVLAEVIGRSSVDRDQYLGDVELPALERLISSEYGAEESIPIQLERVTPWELQFDIPPQPLHHTTATVVVAADTAGNMIVLMLTLHEPFGSGIMAPGTGILLNQAISDFAEPYIRADDETPPEEPIPQPNLVAPGKRPLTRLLPVILLREGKPLLALANSGRERVPSVALQILIQHIDFGEPFEAAVTAPRIHQDTDQQRLQIEWSLPVSVPRLTEKGYRIQQLPRIGSPQFVVPASSPDSQLPSEAHSS